MKYFERRRQAEEDLRLYRNLLALLPYCVTTRRVVTIPQQRSATSVPYCRPSHRNRGRHLGWS